MDSDERTKEEGDGLMTLGWQGFLLQSKFVADPMEKLKQECRQVRELCWFIDGSLQPKPESVTAADWF